MSFGGWFEFNVLVLVGALLMEAAAGYPKRLYAAVRHPVVWVGALIELLDRRWNRETLPDGVRRLNGILCVIAVVAVSVGVLVVVQEGAFLAASGSGFGRWVAIAALAILGSSLLAQRSLNDHVAAVRDGLRAGGLEGGRSAVRKIVGRNPDTLDQAGVARAAVESLAESFSDGVVAPSFWGVIAGLPGMAGYKAINTLDSMIGHRNARYGAFGWCAARMDDLVNLPASRLAALWLVMAAALLPGASPAAAVRAVLRDAGRHRSPNAGWPEAAMAGALNLRLGGPRQYSGLFVDDAWMGEGRDTLDADDIDRALRLFRWACVLQALAVAGLLVAIARW